MNFKKLTGAALLCAAWLIVATAWAFEPFVIKEIRVEGLQRTEPGTVFGYLPVKVGDTLTKEQATAAIHALFATGFFKDVTLAAEGEQLVVRLRERPTIASVEINGVKDFPKQQLIDNLKLVGLAEGRIFDKSVQEKAEHELKRQYVARGKYAVSVKTVIKELERNRVAISFNVVEGQVAKIRQINFIGNQAYSEETLLGLIKLTTPTWASWLTKNDQYSKQKLSADLETLRTFYMDSGYMEFTITSTQVSISPDKKNIYLTLNIAEGPRYNVSEIKVAGPETVLTHDEVRRMIAIQPGDVFSRKAVTEATQKISERLGDQGYAFANVNAVPDIDREKHKVAFTFMVDPGQRVYIRRINIVGNTKTRDEVIRREFRQMEGAWFATERIKESKRQLDRTGFFESVNLETQPVVGTRDQMDINVTVEERPTGTMSIGAGYSNGEGLTFMGSVSQNNLFGTGKQLSAQVNTSQVNQVYSISYTNPYYTDEGVSRGLDAFHRRTNATQIAVSQYTSETLGGGVRYAVPITEEERIHYGASVEQTSIGLTALSPVRFYDYINTFGQTTNNLLVTIGWSRDSRDSALYPTEGVMQRAFIETGLPVSESSQRFAKATYLQQRYYPLTRDLTLMLNAELGAASGFGGKPLPFFKNFYAGGTGSVRGYEPNSLGPRDINNYSLGGDRRIVGSAELLFPVPGMAKERSVRLSVFVDGGGVFGPDGQYPDTEGLRYAAGVAFTWMSPIGPFKLSWGRPLMEQPGDKLQAFQFTLGAFF